MFALESLKSGVVFTQCFWIVKSDHDSFILGCNFCNAVLSNEALFKSASYENDFKTPTILEIVAELFTMLSLLCIFNGGKELSLSSCALTTAWGRQNLRSSDLGASLYIMTQYANPAMAVLAFPVTKVFKYVNLTPSVKDCEAMALLNCPNHSCPCRGSPLCRDKFHSGDGSFCL